MPVLRGKRPLQSAESSPYGKKPQGERWMCRQCSPQWGDVIGYAMKKQNLEFQPALEYLADMYSLAEPGARSDQKEKSLDRGKWIDTAGAFLEACVSCLWSDEGEKALAYLYKRGPAVNSPLPQWSIGFCPKAGQPRRGSDWGIA